MSKTRKSCFGLSSNGKRQDLANWQGEHMTGFGKIEETSKCPKLCNNVIVSNEV